VELVLEELKETVADFSDLAKKAFYLGVGLASYAGEKAADQVLQLQKQGQDLAAEMVKRGEITAADASQWIESFVQAGQSFSSPPAPEPPRQIEILIAEDDSDSPEPPGG
jgi:polyhydroxyalkanoate synthesis regulator phasin